MMFMKKPKAKENSPAPLPPRLTPAQAEAALRAKEVELATRELEEEARFRREQAEAERASWRAAQTQKDQETKAVQTRDQWSKVVAKVVPYLPLVLTNVMAVMGQTGWGRSNLDQIGSNADDPVRWAIALLFAGTLESLALFLGYYGSKALERRDSAAFLYVSAFGVAAVVAGLNYSHYASAVATDRVSILGLVNVPGPTPTAIVFALFSFISPALWRVHSRATNRDKLKAAGEIDTRAVRLSWSRKLWHPLRSVQVMYLATWEGVDTPAEAIALYEARKAARREAKALEAAETAQDAAEAWATAENDPEPEGTPDPGPEGTAAPIVAKRFPEAWEAYAKAAQGGNPLTQRALAKDYLNGNRHHARDIIAAWKEARDHDDDVRTPAA